MHLLWEQDYADEVVRIFRHTLETGEPFFTPERAEFRIDRGVIEYYEWRLDRIPLPDGRNGVVCYFRDISAQVKARKAIEESREALREADRRKDEFLATLSHELRGPLAPLRNTLEIMKRADAGAELLEQARDTMERQLSSLVRLVDDLLDVSRITRNNLELRQERVELASIIQHAVETCRPMAEDVRARAGDRPARGADLRRRRSGAPGAGVQQPAATTPASTASAGAASRSAPRGRRRRGGVDGQGSRPGHSRRTARRGSSTCSRRSTRRSSARRGGLGIGLTLVKRLVEMHGGTVTAHSEGRGRGSEFIVRLPVLEARSRGQRTPRPESPSRAAVATGRRILVVDDNPDSATSLAELLKITGNETPRRDRRRSRRSKPPARCFPTWCCSTSVCRGLNGYDACRRIRAETWGKSLVMVALTGLGSRGRPRPVARGGVRWASGQAGGLPGPDGVAGLSAAAAVVW